MTVQYTSVRRLARALVDWLVSDSTIVTLTGHATGDLRIFQHTGAQIAKVPSLVVELGHTMPYFEDIDSFFETDVNIRTYASTYVAALELAGAVYKLASASPTTYADASFELQNIQTRGIRPLMLRGKPGESQFEAESVRRTERSDVPIPDRYSASAIIRVRWCDIATTP